MTTVTYRGHGNTSPGGGRLVTIERDGQIIGVLRHVVRHSPTGMTWGYGGSGPADLARSLLIDALGDDAKCPTCRGTCQVVYDAKADKDVPANTAGSDGERTDRFSDPMRCMDCEGGYRRGIPYQQFKWDIIADLPEEGWTLEQSAILNWLHNHHRQLPAKP